MTLSKVIAQVERTVQPKNGESAYEWIVVRGSMPRGTAEAVALQTSEHGFRIDGDTVVSFTPPHRIARVEVVPNDMEVVP